MKISETAYKKRHGETPELNKLFINNDPNPNDKWVFKFYTDSAEEAYNVIKFLKKQDFIKDLKYRVRAYGQWTNAKRILYAIKQYERYGEDKKVKFYPELPVESGDYFAVYIY